MRFLASTAGEPERLVAEAMRLLKPGGTLAMQEASFESLRCYPPNPAWDGLLALFAACFPGHIGEPVSQKLYRMLRAAGCGDVQYRPCIVGTRSGDAWIDYLPSTVESLRRSILERGLTDEDGLDRLLTDCRQHLAHPDTVFTSITCIQVWGRKPA
jgi:hypothetical protein